ncbi:mitochondrial 37S ribosomal protein rsm10 [Rhizophlyctis rosea]|nr:mitochondrial 37S ribosomal protein rsm10 [Rhizophlyctis rosea]
MSGSWTRIAERQTRRLLQKATSRGPRGTPAGILRSLATQSRPQSTLAEEKSWGVHNLELPESLDIPAIPAPPHPHQILTSTLTLHSHVPSTLDFLIYFSRHMAHAFSLPTGPIIHPTTSLKRWWMPKGPFVHAKTKEIFEEKKYARTIQTFDCDKSSILLWAEYIRSNLPAGVDMEIETYEWVELDRKPRVVASDAVEAEEGAAEQERKKKLLPPFEEQIRKRREELLKEFAQPPKPKKKAPLPPPPPYDHAKRKAELKEKHGITWDI